MYVHCLGMSQSSQHRICLDMAIAKLALYSNYSRLLYNASIAVGSQVCMRVCFVSSELRLYLGGQSIVVNVANSFSTR